MTAEHGDAWESAGTDGRLVTDDGVDIAYRTWPGPAGRPPVVLHHGFSGDSTRDWVDTGVVAALRAAGRTVVVLDARGHGTSGKPYRVDAYGEDRMARDLSELIDALAVPRIDLVGFSMGAVVAVLAATREPRVRRLVTVGVGAAVAEQGGVDREVMPLDTLVEALLAENGEPLSDAAAQVFSDGLAGRDVDRAALALHARSVHAASIPLDRIAVPTLVLAGDADPFARRPDVLAAAIPGARFVVVAGDHGTCITNPAFTETVVGFLADPP